jgi:hypothetical protein
MLKKILKSALFFVFILNVATAQAATPDNIVYEGRLLDSVNQPLTAAHNFRFSIWSDADLVPGDFLPGKVIDVLAPNYSAWQEEHLVTPNANGTFSLELGSITPLPAELDAAIHKVLQVEVKKSTDPVSAYQLLDPTGDDGVDAIDRKPLSASPYALTSRKAQESTQSSFILDPEDLILNAATGSVNLFFGNTLAKSLAYDFDNSRFAFNDNLHVVGNITLTGTINGVNLPTDIGNRTYTQQNYVTNSESLTTSIDELDQQLKTVSDATHTQNTDTGTVSNSFTLDLDDTGGDIILRFGNTLNERLYWDDLNSRFVFTDDLRVEGDLTVTGTINGENINTIAAQAHNQNTDTGTNSANFVINNGGNQLIIDSSGLSTNRTVSFNDANTVVVGETNTQTLTNKTIDGLNNTLTNISINSLQNRDKTILLKPSYEKMTISEDGTDNLATIKQNFDSIANKIFYYLTSASATLQDLDMYIAVQLPEDFQSFQATPLQVSVRSSSTATTENQLDIALLDTSFTPVALVGGGDLVSTVADAWETKNITFGGGPTFTAGNYIVLHLKFHARANEKIYASEIKFNYVGK